jgi:hypothetical protein
MSASGPTATITERTDQGDQVLVPGVAPVTLRDRLERLLGAPLRPSKPQKPINIGLFDDDARNQLDLF